MNINDTNWNTLFWSLMNDLEKIDDETVINLWEEYEVAALALEED